MMSYYVPLQCLGGRFKKYIFSVKILEKYHFLDKISVFGQLQTRHDTFFWQMSTKAILGTTVFSRLRAALD